MAASTSTPKLWTHHEVAALYNRDERTIRRWIASGKLRAIKHGQTVRVLTCDLIEFMEASRIAPNAPGV